MGLLLDEFKRKGVVDEKLTNISLDEFVKLVSQQAKGSPIKRATSWSVEEYPLMKGQAIYVVDYHNKTLNYSKGIKELLGYEDDEFSLEIVLSYFHPDQYKVLERLIKGAINYGIAQVEDDHEKATMYVLFKARQKSGQYIPLLRQTSIYSTDDNGSMISAYSILSDLSGLHESDRVEWRITGSHINQEHFKRFVYEAYEDFFSKREVEILELLDQNLKSVEVAELINISRHTVDTHRRNMLKKTSCTDTRELLDFAKQNRIIW